MHAAEGIAMTDAAATSIASVSQNRINATLLGVVAALAIINSVILWVWPENGPEIALAFYFGYMILQPVLLGVWTALSTGPIVTRIPIAVACLILLLLAPGWFPASFNRAEKYEFVLFVVAGLSLFVVSFVLFLIFRAISGFRLQWETETPDPATKPLQFSTRYILCLMTICALDLGMTFNLSFQPPPDPGATIFGRNFFFMVLFIGAAVLGGAILPALAVPLCILHGQPTQRAITGSMMFWAVVLLAPIIFFIDQSGPGSSFLVLFLAQLATATVGGAIAFVLRTAGLRLVRRANSQHLAASP
jgi:hypothetical protein